LSPWMGGFLLVIAGCTCVIDQHACPHHADYDSMATHCIPFLQLDSRLPQLSESNATPTLCHA
jgi:hypothetical protein